jgi:hypothetical protein
LDLKIGIARNKRGFRYAMLNDKQEQTRDVSHFVLKIPT